MFIIIFNTYVKDKKTHIDGYFLNRILSDERYQKAESECYDHFPVILGFFCMYTLTLRWKLYTSYEFVPVSHKRYILSVYYFVVTIFTALTIFFKKKQ